VDIDSVPRADNLQAKIVTCLFHRLC